MFYDNSQLARVYLHAWILTSERSQAVTGNEFFRTITKGILDYVMCEILDPEGVQRCCERNICQAVPLELDCRILFHARCRSERERDYSLREPHHSRVKIAWAQEMCYHDGSEIWESAGGRFLTAMRGPDRVRQLIDEYPRQLWLLFGGMLISATGGGMVWPFLTIYLRQHLDIPLTTVALLLTLNSVAGLLSTSLTGPLVDRLGRKGVMFVSLAASCLVYLAMIQADSFTHWTVLIILLGGSGAPFRVGSNAMVADLVEPEGRSNAYALLRIGNNLGIAIGPMIGGFVAAVSYSWAFLIAATAYAIFALLLLLTVKETLPRAESTSAEISSDVGYGVLLRDRHFLAFCLISALAVVPASIIMVLLPVYAKEQYGVIESQYGFIMASNAAMVVFFQYPVTRITKRYSHLPVLAVGTLLYALGVGSVALGRGFVAFLVSMIVTTLGELILVPTGTALAADLSPLDMRGRYMGVYGLSWSLAFGVGPVLGGLLNDNLAPVAIWFGALIVGLLATAGFVLLSRRLRGTTSDQVIADSP